MWNGLEKSSWTVVYTGAWQHRGPQYRTPNIRSLQNDQSLSRPFFTPPRRVAPPPFPPPFTLYFVYHPSHPFAMLPQANVPSHWRDTHTVRGLRTRYEESYCYLFILPYCIGRRTCSYPLILYNIRQYSPRRMYIQSTLDFTFNPVRPDALQNT